MSVSGVSGGEMNSEELSEEDLEQLLTGGVGEFASDHPVAEFLATARGAVVGVAPGEPSGELRKFLETGSAAGVAEVIAITAASGHRRRKLLAAFTATAAGKVAVGVAIAAAATTGAHAARIVDVPLLPEVSDEVVVLADEPAPPATSVVPSTTSPTDPRASTSQTVTSQSDPTVGPSGQRVDLDVAEVGLLSLSITDDSIEFLAAELSQRWSFESVQVVGNLVTLTISDGTDRVAVSVRRYIRDIVVQVRDVRSGDETTDRYSLDGQRLLPGHADTSTAPMRDTAPTRDTAATTAATSTTSGRRSTQVDESTTTSVVSTTTQADRPAERDDPSRRDQSEVTRSQDTARGSDENSSSRAGDAVAEIKVAPDGDAEGGESTGLPAE
jgi:hypothetical protein